VGLGQGHSLGVQSTPDETDHNMTFSRLYNQGEITKKAWKIIIDVLLIF